MEKPSGCFFSACARTMTATTAEVKWPPSERFRLGPTTRAPTVRVMPASCQGRLSTLHSTGTPSKAVSHGSCTVLCGRGLGGCRRSTVVTGWGRVTVLCCCLRVRIGSSNSNSSSRLLLRHAGYSLPLGTLGVEHHLVARTVQDVGSTVRLAAATAASMITPKYRRARQMNNNVGLNAGGGMVHTSANNMAFFRFGPLPLTWRSLGWPCSPHSEYSAPLERKRSDTPVREIFKKVRKSKQKRKCPRSSPPATATGRLPSQPRLL